MKSVLFTIFAMVLPVICSGVDDCWWTGCQASSWAVVGCDQYNRTQQASEDCEGGSKYYCCKELTTTQSPIASCWWTGCQPSSWAVVGCGQYNMTQVDIQDCEAGHKYHCCPGSSQESPSGGITDENLDCVWSACQPLDWVRRGCPPNMKQTYTQSCGNGEGDIFQCCETKNEAQVDNLNILSGETFENFVKFLLFKGKNFTVEPDNVPCLLIDTEKKSILKIKDEGIYVCDLCPYFPQKRFINVFLSNSPSDIKSNILFEDCFGYCFDKQDCVAYSYDYQEHTCYVFNNTIGTFIQKPQWTTVFMTQPMGILESWTYSRHTLISGDILQSTQEINFGICLKKCNQNDACNYVSYEFHKSTCSMFSSQEKIKYVDLNYGYISAFKISSMPVGSDASSRFIETGDDIFETSDKSKINIENKCSSSKNKTHSAFFTKSCFTSPGVGCDIITGCKACYYPENTNDYINLVICPDSEWLVFNEMKENLQNEMRSCLEESICVGVGFISQSKETRRLTLQNFLNSEFTTKFILRYPNGNYGDQSLITKYDFLSNYDIEKIDSGVNTLQEIKGKSLKECLGLFDSNPSFIRMSFSNNKCKISTEEVKFIPRNGDFVTIFKKPDITSPIINYVRTPGFSIEANKANQSFGSCNNNCEEICAKKCNEDFYNWCSHFTVQKDVNRSECLFFNLLNDNLASNTIIQQMKNVQIFTKLSGLDFSLDSLNKLNPFQSTDIYNCFKPDSENKQTATSLSEFENTNNNKELLIRRKRGFFDFIKKAVKAVGNFVVDTVKDLGKGIVDTAKGVANTVKNVVKGDFKKAKESFVSIPIVKDVKNVVDLGKAVVTGDWDTAKERGADLLQSHTLDMATSLIPGGGKLIGKGLKTIGKAIKKQTGRIKESTKHNLDKVNENNKKVNKDKNDINTDRNNCKRRTKRAVNKRSKPGSCSDDDDDDDLCPNPNIRDVIEVTLSSCKNRKKNAVCEFECEVGYDEPDKKIKCLGPRNARPSWTPAPSCRRIDCGVSPYPLITLQTPQVSTFGTTEFGTHITVYVVLYQKLRKLPFWSIALHQSTQFRSKDYTASKAVKRAGSFKPFPCPELRNYQASSQDYSNSGWDQGHLTPANVARWSEKARLSSNLFINVAPQDPYTNQVPWKLLETIVECFSRKRRSLVATGICNNAIGRTTSGLEVPACYWKMVCYKDENGKEQVIGFITPNSHITPTRPNKDARRNEVFKPRSQREIKQLLQGINSNMRSPWTYSASKINAGRPVAVGGDSSVWFPVNPFDCERADDLSQEELNQWLESLPKYPKTKKPKKSRTKRQTKAGFQRGCNSESDLRNMQSLLGIESERENEDAEDGEEGHPDEGGNALVNVQSCKKRIIGYYTSWGDKKISGRELKRLTHVIYAFLEMKEDGSVDVGSADRKNAININEEVNKAKERLENLMELAALYPHVKVMFAVGGWENSQYFSAVAASPQKRITFIASIIKMIQRYGFDGVDIDWEYPVTGGANEGIPQDKPNYVNLMKEIRSALDNLANEASRSEKFLLSFAGAAGQWTLDPGFDLPGLLKHADFVNIMTYDYFGAWSSKWGAYTGPPSPLYFGMPARFSGKTNADWTVKYYTCKSKQPHKINMGVPFYGRYWKNVGPPVDGKDGMWRTAERSNGIFEGGYVAWNKISEFLGKGGFEQNFHEKSKSPYAWDAGSKTFLGYENEKSLKFKVDYAVQKNVGGIMIWSVELDDDDLTLLNTVYQASLCDKTNPNEINHKCSPINEKRWWTSEDGDEMAGLCGRSAPLYKGYYPVCDPDDPGYSCCGPAGYCGSGEKYCDCPTCKNYGENPNQILEAPIKPTVPVTWYFLNAEEGKRGRCGRKVPKINGIFPTCNPDDENAYCCSNGGFCGSKSEHCTCNGCVNFKNNKNYRYGPKKWWDLSDGEDKAGKCGPKAPKVDGVYEAECEPNTKFSCCSSNGFCGSGPDYCNCPGCKKFT